MSRPGARLVVLGVGNTLLGDDGVGVRVVRELIRLTADGAVTLPDRTAVLDGGTLGADLLDRVAGSRALVVVDAADLRAAPGTIEVLRGDALATAGGPASPRRTGVGELLDLARLAGVLPAEVALVAVQPGTLDVGLELSGPVLNAVPAAVATVLEEIGRCASLARRPETGAAA